MKKAFDECYRAVLTCEDDTGRKRCELFKELLDKRVRDNDISLCVGLDRVLNNPQKHPDYH